MEPEALDKLASEKADLRNSKDNRSYFKEQRVLNAGKII